MQIWMAYIFFAYLFHFYNYTNSESEGKYTIYIFYQFSFFLIYGKQKSGPPQPEGECRRTHRIPLPYGPEISDMLKIVENCILIQDIRWKVIFYDMNFILYQIQ